MDDLISRAATIDAIDEYMVGKNCATDGTMMASLINELVIKRLPSAQPEQPSFSCGQENDTISRLAAIDAVEHITSSMSVCVNTDECHGMQRMQRQAVIELANLPSVQPEPSELARNIATIIENEMDMRVILKNAEQPKKGGWNFIGDDMFECSMCGVSYTAQQLNSLRNYDTDPYLPWFCPHCGSDMRGE